MRPLEPLRPESPIARLLKAAPAVEVRAEMARLEALSMDGARAAARIYAKGALSLREGALDAAHADLGAAADAFAAAGEKQASLLARCDRWLAAIRRGPRGVYAEAIAGLTAIAREGAGDALVEVVATHYRGTAERFSGDALATQSTLLQAFARSEPFLEERAQLLNSIGTLYVVLGALGAATAMLEHAAELHHQNGDAMGEAIAYGQLGSAALARGELELARKYLQKQEWFASRIGDAFGRSRALVFLADVALELGRHGDAIEYADLALGVASSVQPPLTIWLAYATRAKGRAKTELGDATARAELEEAIALFAKIGNQLGDALARWDLAHLAARTGAQGKGAIGSAGGPTWFSAAWAFASLGLTMRVAQLLRDERAIAKRGGGAAASASEQTVAVVAQAFPHVGVAQELDLVYGEATELAAIATRRTSGQRNLGRLAALCIAPAGLVVAALASAAIGPKSSVPSERSAAAAAGELPGLAVLVWPLGTPLVEVARDLASMRVSLGEDARAAIALLPEARVVAPPFAGEVGARLDGVEVAGLLARASALKPGGLAIPADIDWSSEAEARAVMGGYEVQRA